MGSDPHALANRLKGFRAAWYQTEKNTAVLVKAVLQCKKVSSLGGEDLWSLLKLTWITSRGQEVCEDHWKTLKVPAPAQLFGCEPVVLDTLKASIEKMPLPAVVAQAAIRGTGIVNFRRVWRNSALDWCKRHIKQLRIILRKSAAFSANNEPRLEVSRLIEALPSIPSPNGKTHAGPELALSPLIAAIDPTRIFLS